MDHVVYIAASGAGEAMLAQAVNTNNLANASTVGFRADLMRAESAYLNSQQFGSRIHAANRGLGVDVEKGTISTTGRDLDIAINGDGWIAVQGEGEVQGLSRRGDLRVDGLGQLLDGEGAQVLGNGGPISLPPYSKVSIGADGTISIVPLGESPSTLAAVDRIRLVNPEKPELFKAANGLIQTADGELPPVDAAVRIIPGALESSNVDSVGAMVHMIELARQFESHTKMMKVAEQLDSVSADLMKMS